MIVKYEREGLFVLPYGITLKYISFVLVNYLQLIDILPLDSQSICVSGYFDSEKPVINMYFLKQIKE